MEQIKDFAKKQGKEWKQIFQAWELSKDYQNRIKGEFASKSLFGSDADLVVFGSIARNECTIGSDVDWTLLVDGQANADHRDFAHLIEDAIVKIELTKPGTTGMFGQTTFSHDLIHYIGGEDDTNHNISRRILLLLESERINVGTSAKDEGSAHDRVIRGILNQYIKNDSGFSASGKENVPRFLLNDIIRFWRTMCVDFAYKQWEQKGKKWALRNIKLRMARKLIYVKGLLMCLKSFKSGWNQEEIKSELRKCVAQKPLEFMVSSFIENKVPFKYIVEILDSYENYLSMLNDKDFRDHLKNLDMHKAYGDPIFEKARVNSHKFQDALTKVFIEEDGRIRDFTLKYTVF